MGVSRLHDIHDMSMTLVATSLNDQFGSNCVLTELTILLCFLLKFAKLTGYLDISTEFCLEIHVRLAGLFMQATTMGCASPM